MRLLVLLVSLLMPVVAWLSQRGVFGPDNGTVSDAYPTLLVAAGYAFSIWGLIFLLDVAYGAWQATGERRRDEVLARIAPAAAMGFALTAAWMPLFSRGLFWLCVIVIFGALACTAWCAVTLSRARRRGAALLLPWAALSLHAGWLSLAAFLNLAQTIVAYELLSTTSMLGWSLVLLAGIAVVLLVLNARMHGNPAFIAAVLWGVVAVYVKQSQSALAGADVAAWAAVAIGLAVLAQTAWLLRPAARVAASPR